MTTESNQNRRSFLKKTLAYSAGTLSIPTILPSSVFAGSGRTMPNDRINLGFIGVGGMGTGHVRSFVEHGDVHVAAVCDVNGQHASGAAELINKHNIRTYRLKRTRFLPAFEMDRLVLILMRQEAHRRSPLSWRRAPVVW